MKPTKVLFVCLGNICRSPLAEAIFKRKIKERNIDHLFYADSCGTANYHIGDSPDPRTIKNAIKNNMIINHTGRQLDVRDLEDFDLILAMDESNMGNIMRMQGAIKHSEKIKLMRSYDSVGINQSVPDPYYGTEADFQNVFDILDRSVDGLLQKLDQ